MPLTLEINKIYKSIGSHNFFPEIGNININNRCIDNQLFLVLKEATYIKNFPLYLCFSFSHSAVGYIYIGGSCSNMCLKKIEIPANKIK